MAIILVTMVRLIDISVPITRGLPTWPGSTGFTIEQTLSFERGDEITVSRLDLDVHTGTHVESALHYVAGGDPVETLPLEAFIGPALVIDLRSADAIGADELEAAGIPDGTERLLLRTRNSGSLQAGQDFRQGFVGLTLDGASWIAERSFRLVGTDYLSIQRFGDDPETHRVLMRAGVAILEGLDLSGVDAGEYRITCLPIKLHGTEAAPARVILEAID
jgi:arylformamidase